MWAWVPAVWLIVVVGTATSLAVRRPEAARRTLIVLITGLLVAWCVLCAVGIAVQVQQGPGVHAVEADTPYHWPHRWLGHASVALTWVTFWWSIPVTIERAIRLRLTWGPFFQLAFASASLAFVLLSAFTAYLGGAPVTEPGYLRFRLLHTLLLPFVATLCLVGWRVAMGRFRKT